MSARRTSAASPSISSEWWRSIEVAIDFGSPQRRASTPPTTAWSTPSSRRSRLMRSSGVRASRWTDVRIAGVGVHQHELADVVQQRGDDQAVAIGIADLAGEQFGGRAGREGVQAEAVGRRVPDRAALEEVERAHALGELLHCLGREDPHGVDDVLDPRDAARRHVVGDAHHRDDERDVGLDGLDDLGERHAVAADEGEQPVARLGERREALERLERRGQTAAVALTRPSQARAPLRATAATGYDCGLIGCH